MKLSTLLCGFVFGVGAVLLATQGVSRGAGPSGLSDTELVRAMKDMAAVGEGHRFFRSFKPKNAQTIKWWRSPRAKPNESKSRSESKWILDSRFLTQKIRGGWLGASFEGFCILGYDNGTQEYQMVWMDTFSTRIMFSRGRADESGQAITLHGEYFDPIDDKTRKVKTVFKFLNKKGDTLLTMFDVTSPDKESKFLEVASKKWIPIGA